MALHIDKGVFGIKAETTRGTFNKPDAADCFPVEAFEPNFSIDYYERGEKREHYGKYPSIPGIRYGSISVTFLLNGSGTAGTPPHWNEALMACGLSHANVPATSDTYKVTSVFTGLTIYPSESYSVAYWEDGVRYGLNGCLGEWELTCAAGMPLKMKCTYHGALEDWADEAVPTPTGVSTAVPPNFLGVSLETIGGFACVFEQITFRSGNVMSMLKDANAVSGVRGYEIPGRRLSGSFDPDMVLVATDGIFDDWKLGTTGALSTGVIGSTAGNRIAISAPLCQYRKISLADKEGRRVVNADFDIVTSPSSVDGDDFSITLT